MPLRGEHSWHEQGRYRSAALLLRKKRGRTGQLPMRHNIAAKPTLLVAEVVEVLRRHAMRMRGGRAGPCGWAGRRRAWRTRTDARMRWPASPAHLQQHRRGDRAACDAPGSRAGTFSASAASPHRRHRPCPWRPPCGASFAFPRPRCFCCADPPGGSSPCSLLSGGLQRHCSCYARPLQIPTYDCLEVVICDWHPSRRAERPPPLAL